MNDHRDMPRSRSVTTVLDVLRARIDNDAFDAAIFALETVVADLGYGDVRPLPGSIAWIDRLREQGKSTALVFSGENAVSALEIAGVSDRFDAVVSGPRRTDTLVRALEEIGVPPERAIVADTAPAGIAAAQEISVYRVIAVARGPASPEELRQAGADGVVADLQELIRATR
jgi:beta-phosphoglucomutase-like phosphatase (HAD superfamily)